MTKSYTNVDLYKNAKKIKILDVVLELESIADNFILSLESFVVLISDTKG